MKKKITYIATAVAIFCAAFFVGRNSVDEYQAACDFMGSVVDWNTNGEELSVLTDEDYEFYAYRAEGAEHYEKIYGNRR